jgi:hypothetical protein
MRNCRSFLQQAYERKLLREHKLIAAKRLIEQRRRRGKRLQINRRQKTLSSTALLRAHREVRPQPQLVEAIKPKRLKGLTGEPIALIERESVTLNASSELPRKRMAPIISDAGLIMFTLVGYWTMRGE